MTPLEAALIVIIIAILLFVVYYYWRGAKGEVSLSRPVESRVDEYLDRRFELMIDEWSLISRTKLQSFRDAKEDILAKDETRIAALKDFREQMSENLAQMEKRLDALEKQTGPK